MNTVGLDETTWLTFKADVSVTEVWSLLKSVDLLVRGLLKSFSSVEASLGIVSWTFKVVTCLVVLWVFTVFGIRSLTTDIVGLLFIWIVLVCPTGLCVDE